MSDLSPIGTPTVSTSINEEYYGTLKVFETFNKQKSEVNESDYEDELSPSRPFAEVIDIVNKDTRLQLSSDSYVQMILGSGLQVKAKDEKLQEFVRNWMEEIEFEEKIEDGLPSYVDEGNMIFETAPGNVDFVEVPIETVLSIVRDRKGNVIKYIQDVNNRRIDLQADNICHFKFTNARKETWGRGIFHAVVHQYRDPKTGILFEAPIITMKKIEEDMGLIFDNYASPMQMFYFEDAGEQFIKTQADEIKKAKAGAKLVTDKKFEVETFEVRGNPKFDKYIEHLQQNVVEPGSQFPIQMFNAGFTARAASETSDSVVIRKIKRIQKRLAKQIKNKLILPYLRAAGKRFKPEEIDVMFEFENKAEMSVPDAITLYRDNGIKRSELRKYLVKATSIDIDQTDMEDLPPITSVTPTNDMDKEEEPEDEMSKMRMEIERLREVVERKKGRPKKRVSVEVQSDFSEPFGPFKDFEDCVSQVKSKRPELSDEEVNKICGALQRDLESKHYKKKRRELDELDATLKKEKLAIMREIKKEMGEYR